MVSTLIGDGNPGSYSSTTQLVSPSVICLDELRNTLYTINTATVIILKAINLQSGIMTNIYQTSFVGNNVGGCSVSPENGHVYVSANYQVHELNSSTGDYQIIRSVGKYVAANTNPFTAADGTDSAIAFAGPGGIALNRTSPTSFYVTDSTSYTSPGFLREVRLVDGITTSYTRYSYISYLHDIVLDYSNTYIYATGGQNHIILRIFTVNWVMNTLVGVNAQAGYLDGSFTDSPHFFGLMVLQLMLKINFI
jgi:hypothetical protein